VEQLRSKDRGRAAELDDWFMEVGSQFRDRIIDVMST
jgi:hypothetical protein